MLKRLWTYGIFVWESSSFWNFEYDLEDCQNLVQVWDSHFLKSRFNFFFSPLMCVCVHTLAGIIYHEFIKFMSQNFTPCQAAVVSCSVRGASLGIIGRHLIYCFQYIHTTGWQLFLHWVEEYSSISSKALGNFLLWSLEFEPVVPFQTRPVHL